MDDFLIEFPIRNSMKQNNKRSFIIQIMCCALSKLFGLILKTHHCGRKKNCFFFFSILKISENYKAIVF